MIERHVTAVSTKSMTINIGITQADSLCNNVNKLINGGKIQKEQFLCEHMYDVLQIMIGWEGRGGYLTKLYVRRLSLEIQPFTFLHTVEPPVTAKGDTSLHLILLAEEIFLSLLPIAVNDSKLTFTFSFGFSPA